MATDNDPDETTRLSQVKDRTDDIASAQASIIERTLAEKGDQMDPDTKSQFLTSLLELRGQLKSSEARASAERRMDGGVPRKF
jgi:hypothetical protein